MNVGLVRIKRLDEKRKAKKYSLRQVFKSKYMFFYIKIQGNFFFMVSK